MAVTDLTPPARKIEASQKRPPLWRNSKFLSWLAQIVILLLVVGAFLFLVNTAADGLAGNNIQFSFDWVNGPANIQLSEGIDTNPPNAGRALWVGMVNTVQTAAIGILLSTILGVLIGLARLSNNFLASRAASAYIETIRNVPVLVQILLWLFIIGRTLPELQNDDGESVKGLVFLSQRGLAVPRVFYADGFYQWVAFIAIGGLVAIPVRKYFNDFQAKNGGRNNAGTATLAIIALFAVIGWFVNPVMGFLGSVFGAPEEAWANIPQPVMQLIMSGIAFALAISFIVRFLNSRRTPAGLAKLTDDDYFRMIFALVGAALFSFAVWVVWPGLSSWFINSGSDFWGWLGDKFGGERGSRPLDGQLPTITGGNFANYGPTGWNLTVFRAALLVGLVLYTASFIAEIVRGGILAVAKGQTEAASALGLNRIQSLRKVILPQAFRIVMPPLGNQYLNITKNTSLAIAVGLSDVVQVGQSIFNKNGQALAVFVIWMAFFLSLSLTISFVVNQINNRLKIVER